MRIEMNAAAKLLSTRFRSALLAGLSMLALTSCGGGGDHSITCLYSAPRITSSPPTVATAGYQYTYPISAAYNCAVSSGVEACYDVVVVQLPAGASSGGNSISWNPPASEVNTDVNLAVSTPPDICGNRATQSWTVHVYAPPVIESFIAERTLILPGENTVLTAVFQGSGRIEGLGTVTSGAPIATPALTTSTTFMLIVTNSVGADMHQALTIDVTATVTSTNPGHGATEVPVNRVLIATFSKKMDGATITSGTFLLKDGSNNPVRGTVTYADQVAIFAPANLLSVRSPYTASITSGIKDLSGNPMAGDYMWSITTGSALDTTLPVVISTFPANAADRVQPEDIRLLVTFSESIDPRSVNSSTFILKDSSGNPVVGAVRVTNGGNSAEFSPSAALAPMSSYMAIVTTEIRDLSGNTLAADYSWTFSTKALTWRATSTNAWLPPRTNHTAVWTGSEMIVWGIYNDFTRYNPVTDVWAATSYVTGRSLHTAVWTGSEMIVWGGLGSQGFQNTGARYNPVTDTWLPISNIGAPSARAYHTAIWTGSEMIVWGGGDSFGMVQTGARYNPVTDVWAPTSMTDAPSARAYHTATWTGSEMIVWGGHSSTFFGSGARYDPVTNAWTRTSNIGAPAARSLHTAVWTGSEMIVWGGSTYDSTGARYNPVTDVWAPTSNIGAPSARDYHTAVWTGSEMIVWGGRTNDSTGARYNPMTGAWLPTLTAGAPTPRFGHTAVWTGSEMIVWGGRDIRGDSNTGSRYRP